MTAHVQPRQLFRHSRALTLWTTISIHVGLEQLRLRGVAGVADPETQGLVSNDKFLQEFLTLYKINKGEVRNSLMVNLLRISVSKQMGHVNPAMQDNVRDF